ncbi:YybH family protein [Pedobacter miscanthi]|uniref:YybH family protein n=1 Tax=Pedobacter miscanthi TaxID=2259170 RepID=UPI00292E93B8|nr:nuclear transport factor 2 family protein [Pedobacter miscanthi]
METPQEKSAIEKLIFSFSDAFNAADIPNTVASFTSDGINMANNAPVAQGADQLVKTFGFLFNMAKINIEYVIDEVILNDGNAVVRTNSKVTTSVIASGEKIFLENKELFVLRKETGEWKISHYIFNNTKTTK